MNGSKTDGLPLRAWASNELGLLQELNGNK